MTAPGLTHAKHRLLLELGRGGMGTVFLAVSEGPAGFSKKKVVKRLRADLASDPQFLRMFLDEARLSARIAHPNVVSSHEVGWDGSHYFLEMEYLEGQTLDALLRATHSEAGALPIADALWILTQVLGGLHHAHELADDTGAPLQVVHRDVSPHNVMVTYDGGVKVLDFGIAKAADSSVDTRTGVVKGKVTYMAPEQARRGVVDRRADVFAVGVILWQMLARRRLWSDLSEGEIFVRLERGEIPAPRDVAPEIPEALDAICRKAIAASVEERYASARAMEEAIEAWLAESGERVGTRRVGEILTRVFGETRASVRREIEARMFAVEEGDEGDADLDVPMLGHSPAYAQTRSAEIGAATVSGTRAPAEATKRRGWTWMTAGAVAIAIAVVGIAGARAGAGARAEAGARARARAGVRRTSEDCRVLAEPGDEENPSTLWIGAMFPLSGPDAARYGQANANAAELGRRDFAMMTSGLPATTRGEPARPIGLVMCDDAVNPERAARHLVDVGVPAVIGFHRSKESTDLAASTFLPNDVLAVAALNTSPLVTRVPQAPGTPRLVWRTNVSSDAWIGPLARVVSDVHEPALHAEGVGRIRVAVVRSTNSATTDAADALFTALRFNGKSAAENGDAFRSFAYDETSPNGHALAGAIAEYAPHVILYLDEDLFTESLLAPIEAAWPAGARLPLYASAGVLASRGLHEFVGDDASRRSRFLGVDVPASTLANVKLAMRYSEVFTPRVTAATAPGVAYDAFYAIAYAAFAAGEEHPRGSSLSRAFARIVPPGVPIDVGPSRIFDAIEALRAGKNIDLGGAVTRLDFDLATGEASSDFAVYRLDPTTGEAVESGVVFGQSVFAQRKPTP